VPAALLLATITGLLALLCAGLRRRTGEAHFGWWSFAFGLFFLRILAIIAFLSTADRTWLFWHQVITGWTGLALLWAAIVFAHEVRWRRWFWAAIAFPPVWSYFAVVELDSLLLAAVPAVAFLSAATLWTGRVFLVNRRPGTDGASRLLGWTFVLWGIHHLDYPLLRAGGAWSPWGYYLDILFILATGAGILLLVNAELAARLLVRTQELERLSVRMVRQHEDERRKLSAELHDETAQVLASVTMQLGAVREEVGPALTSRLDRVIVAVDEAMRGVRRITNDLRPALLDDLGLLPAMRSLVADFGERNKAAAAFDAPARLPELNGEAELALFRALQESLANVARHAPGVPVQVALTTPGTRVALRVTDEGPGFAGGSGLADAALRGRLGLIGMRERIAQLGGIVEVRTAPGAGVTVDVSLPVSGALVA
jgi:signal transduction histidine kinase